MKRSIKKLLGVIYYNLIRRHQNDVGNRIVLYHSIGTKLDFDTYGISISKERFLEHIKYLKNNYEIIPINEYYKENLDRKTISITFDDGFRDNLYALSVCEKYSIPFSIYVTTGFIGEKNYLTEGDIVKLSKSKECTLGVHSHTHPHLGDLTYDEQYNELKDSKEILENLVGYRITQMSLPHGSYNSDTMKILNILGYSAVLSSNIGLNCTNNLDLIKLKRVEIVASDDVNELERKLNGYYDYL